MPTWMDIDGPSDYSKVLNQMESIVFQIIEGKASDTIIITEHKDVITSGTSANDSEIISTPKIEIIPTGRGGKYTFHGKGQRVIYPIIDLNLSPWNRDLKKYLNFLHDWIILTLSKFNIQAFKRSDHIGVWVKKNSEEAKIAAIGIRAKKWVVYHGIAVNLTTDLRKYDGFIPCGISNLGVTSAKELGTEISFKDFDENLKESYNILLSKI